LKVSPFLNRTNKNEALKLKLRRNLKRVKTLKKERINGRNKNNKNETYEVEPDLNGIIF